MDRVAKGMSKAGRRQTEEGCEQPDQKSASTTEKVKEKAKGAVRKVGDSLKATGQKIKEAAE
jgi:hypothetical protein